MENGDLFVAIDHKLDVLIRLAALIAIKEKKLAEGAPLLSACGLDNEAIADIYGTTAHSVSSRLTEAKKNNKKKDG